MTGYLNRQTLESFRKKSFNVRMLIESRNHELKRKNKFFARILTSPAKVEFTPTFVIINLSKQVYQLTEKPLILIEKFAISFF